MPLQITSIEQLQKLMTPEQIMRFLDGTSLKVIEGARARAVVLEFRHFTAEDWLIVYFLEVLTILMDFGLSQTEKLAAIDMADLPVVYFQGRNGAVFHN